MMKTKNKLALISIFSSVCLCLPYAAQAASVDDMAKECDDCHGSNGVSEKEKVPTIAGYSSPTIEDIMAQYKAGDRPADKYKTSDGKETDMQEIAKNMSDDDISAIAAHYASQTHAPAKQDFDAALAEKGKALHEDKCDACHSEGGSAPEDDATILAGQWKAYLERQFALMKSGERDIPKKMKKKLKKYSDDDIKALIEFYASEQ